MRRAFAFRYVRGVEFRPEDYGPEVARVLNLAGGGKRLLPLVRCGCVACEASDALRGANVSDAALRAGLYVHCGCWDLAHELADSVHNPNGYFWHGIVHRLEPDAANSAYWFGMTGVHPVFSSLAAEAAAVGYATGTQWDPFAFIDFCESARQKPGSAEEKLAELVQLIEWQLLFDHCARSQNG
jgi:hypothetical protein